MKARVALKQDKWCIIISYKENDKYKQRCYSTGLVRVGNKKKAESMLNYYMQKFNDEIEVKNKNDVVLNYDKYKETTFLDYIMEYIEFKKDAITPNTYSGYKFYYKEVHKYFERVGLLSLKLIDLKKSHLLNFYDYLRDSKKYKEISIKKISTIIHPAFDRAYEREFIEKNPCVGIKFDTKLKQKQEFESYCYTDEEMNLFLNVLKGHKMELLYKLIIFYGLRRSEVLGLKFDNINFENETISITQSITKANKASGFYINTNAKNKTSKRTLPLFEDIKKLLLTKINDITESKEEFNHDYNNKYDGYICVNEIGDLYNPDYITKEFAKIIKRNKLRHTRLHDCRHYTGTMLVNKGMSVKTVQEWLGHADSRTTMKYYVHSYDENKLQAASVINEVFKK